MSKFLPMEVFWIVMSAFHLTVIGYIKGVIRFLIPDRFITVKQKDVSGQVVLITGGGSGIGRLLSIEFSKLDAVLVLLDLSREALLGTKNLIGDDAKVFLYECDVSDRRKVYAVATRIKSEVGRVDILVNNAGIVSGKKFLDLEDSSIQKTMEVNALAHFWLCKAFLPDMMSSDRGHVVSISSLAGVSGLPNLTDYCASKFAAVGLMESLRLELDAQGVTGVRLTTVCPSLIATGLFEGTRPPLTVLMSPEYVAKEIMKAILEEIDFVMLPRWMYFIILLKWTMPRKAVERFYENSGLLHFMDTFRGRSHSTEDTNKTE